MNKWFFINFIIIVYVLWKLFMSSLDLHILLGGIGLLLILYNWTRHAFFSTIRSNIKRSRKIMFANITKKALPIHKWTGSTALLVVIGHFVYTSIHYNFYYNHAKAISGLSALFVLILVVLFGWLRHIRTTPFRRYTHWVLAYILISLVVLHIVLI